MTQHSQWQTGKNMSWSVCLAIGFCLFASPALAIDSGGAQAQTEALVAAYRSCCVDGGQPSNRECQAVDRYFDYARLARSTAAPLTKKLKATQQKRLIDALEDIFARTARQSGAALCTSSPRILPAKPHAEGSVVALEVLEPGEDVPTRLAFVWRQNKERWQVVDLELEGGSLVTDYQNQFSRIEHKEGATGLLRRVEARRTPTKDRSELTEHKSAG